MADKEQLGQLTRVELRDIWANEASDFTPWLAREENLATLSDTLGIPLELEAKEKAVGSFSADILCKDMDSGALVLIENQLEKTDHTHLGQLLTYASGLEAVVIVWIAKNFTDEHRSALDWLNSITDPSVRFFGIELELWKIGDSLAAPRFHIVAKPNNWSRSVAQAAHAIGEKSDTELLHEAYWAAFCEVLNSSQGPVSAQNRGLQPWSSMSWGLGRTSFSLYTGASNWKRRISVGLYMKGNHAKAHYCLLREQKAEIENELGYPLDWAELRGIDQSVGVELEEASEEDRDDWPRQHKWLADKLGEFHRVFAGRVRELNADDWRPEPDSEGAEIQG